MVYVFEPGAAIEDYFSQNSMHVVSTKGFPPQSTGGYEADVEESDSANQGLSQQQTGGYEADAEESDSDASANEASSHHVLPASLQATYCGLGLSKPQCILQTLEASVLFENMLSTFAVVSTYA